MHPGGIYHLLEAAGLVATVTVEAVEAVVVVESAAEPGAEPGVVAAAVAAAAAVPAVEAAAEADLASSADTAAVEADRAADANIQGAVEPGRTGTFADTDPSLVAAQAYLGVGGVASAVAEQAAVVEPKKVKREAAVAVAVVPWKEREQVGAKA